ncbi:MAG TPA: MurR/RpiR family transcriptional regulator [Candidatus Pelethocola excrementipullorum]|nr:MurR/RpiR family transcriptional regulator [Candidatus Pelethocola excrementipullorum]
MDSHNFLLKIQSSYNQFTKAEKKVADYILREPKQVLLLSISDLADACDVGDTSVYRFCRTLGLKGYQEFKMKLSLSQGAKDTELRYHTDLKGRQEIAGDFAEKTFHQHIDAIRETYMLLDREQFSKTLELLKQARRVFFFGIGDSLLTAEEARNKFLRITGKVVCITDPHMQAMAAATMTEEDMIFIISYSGATKDNIQVVKAAKAGGARIACITHFHKSPLTRYADAVLLCGADEGVLDGGSLKAKGGQLYLIDLLYQKYYEQNYEECKRNNEKTAESVVEKLY